jgi:alkaline phosphatase
VLDRVARDGETLVVLTSDHAQPESTIGVVLPASLGPDGATPPGGCTTPATGDFPLTLGSKEDAKQPCPLQDAVGTFDDASFPTYADANGDGFPDDPDPSVKLVMDDAGRPTYKQDYRTNFRPLSPAGASAALPNPKRDPDGLLMTGNMPTRSVPGSAAKTEGDVGSAPHAADDVILAASGPGAAVFAGIYENTDVFVRIAAALGGARARRELERGSGFSGVPPEQPPASELLGF